MNVTSDSENWIYYYGHPNVWAKLRIDSEKEEREKEKEKENESERGKETKKEEANRIGVSVTAWKDNEQEGHNCLAVCDKRRLLGCASVYRRGLLMSGPYNHREDFRFFSLRGEDENGEVRGGPTGLPAAKGGGPTGPVGATLERIIRFPELINRKEKKQWKMIMRGRGPWLYFNADDKVYGVDVREIDAALHPLPSLQTLAAVSVLTDRDQSDIESLHVSEDLKEILRKVQKALDLENQ